MPRRLHEGRIQRPRKQPEEPDHQGLSRHNPGVGIMTKGMDRDVLAQARCLGGPDADPMDRPVCEGTAGDVPGEEPFGRPSDLPVFAEHGQESRREHHVAVLAPLALANPDDHPPAVDVGDAQPDDLGDAQAGGVCGHQDGAMLEAGDPLEELRNLVEAQDGRELLHLPRRSDALHDPVLAERDPVEEAEGADGLPVVAPGDVPSPGRGRGDRPGRRRRRGVRATCRSAWRTPRRVRRRLRWSVVRVVAELHVLDHSLPQRRHGGLRLKGIRTSRVPSRKRPFH